MPLRLIKRIGQKLFGKKPAERTHKPAVPHAVSPASARPAAPGHGPAEHPRHAAAPAHAHRARTAADDAPASRPERAAPAAERAPRHGPAQRTASPAEAHAGWTSEQFPVPPVEGKLRFHDLDLPGEILHAIADLGFEYCTPIQAATLPSALAGLNVAGQAQTGTGKTAAFLITALARFLRKPPPAKRPNGTPRALVLAPTRELAVQIDHDARLLAKYCGVECLAVYGGMDFEKQERILASRPVDLVVATPGRLLDFRQRGRLHLRGVEVLVIDEADRMLDMGFIPDVRTIVHSTPPRDRRQTLLFSATLSEDVMRLTENWMPNPELVRIEPERITVATVDQKVLAVSAREKFPVLFNLLEQKQMTRVLVFGNRRDTTQYVADLLRANGVPCGLLSGDIPQQKRMRILEDFRGGVVRVVVATDVAARGLHIEGVSHVINYDFPYEPESYVHRIGRTGRVGATGTAISFACEEESFCIPELEKFIGRTLPCEVPEEALVKPPPVTSIPRPERPSFRDRAGDRRGPPRRSGGGRSGPPRRR